MPAALAALSHCFPSGPATTTKSRPKRSSVDRRRRRSRRQCGARKPGPPVGSRGFSHVSSSSGARDGGRPVAVAELDGRLVDDRHQILRAERRVEAQHVAGVRLLRRERADRLPLARRTSRAAPRPRGRRARTRASTRGRTRPGCRSCRRSRRSAASRAPSRRRGRSGPPRAAPRTPRTPTSAARSRSRPRCRDRRAPRARSAMHVARSCPRRCAPTRVPSSSIVEFTTRKPAWRSIEKRKNPCSRGPKT